LKLTVIRRVTRGSEDGNATYLLLSISLFFYVDYTLWKRRMKGGRREAEKRKEEEKVERRK